MMVRIHWALFKCIPHKKGVTTIYKLPDKIFKIIIVRSPANFEKIHINNSMKSEEK